jgi:membrane protein DedA with SNARE-associated domain
MLWDLTALAGAAYLVIFVFTVVDGFFPVVPAETTIITGGALAAAGDLHLPGVLAVTWAAVITGDLFTHEVARRGGGRLLARWERRERPKRALDWATRTMRRRGPVVVTVGRFVPLGRTAVSLVSGYAALPRRQYLPALMLGCTAWTVYVVSLGYLGGQVLGSPLVSVALAISLSFAITGVAALVKRVRRRAQT